MGSCLNVSTKGRVKRFVTCLFVMILNPKKRKMKMRRHSAGSANSLLCTERTRGETMGNELRWWKGDTQRARSVAIHEPAAAEINHFLPPARSDGMSPIARSDDMCQTQVSLAVKFCLKDTIPRAPTTCVRRSWLGECVPVDVTVTHSWQV